MARRVVDSYTRISSKPGDTVRGSHFGKHLGYDYSLPEGNAIKSPVSGVVTQSYLSGSVGHTYEIKEDGNGRLHRLMHMRTRPLRAGNRVKEGQTIAESGGAKGKVYSGSTSTGPHVHHDVRKANTSWNSSYSNYIDWEAVIKTANQPTPTPGGTTYTVVKGDNLTKIGGKFGISWQTIYNANKGVIGSDPNKLKVGTKLTIPKASTKPTRKYTVKKGDNLTKIAKNYGTTWQKLYNANKAVVGNDPDKLKVGLVLTIP